MGSGGACIIGAVTILTKTTLVLAPLSILDVLIHPALWVGWPAIGFPGCGSALPRHDLVLPKDGGVAAGDAPRSDAREGDRFSCSLTVKDGR